MITDLNSLHRLTSVQIRQVAEMMARAFQDFPGLIFYVPDASERAVKAYHLFYWMISYGLMYGEVYSTSPNLEGVAVWLPSEKAKTTLWRNIRSGAFPMILKIGITNTLNAMSFETYVSQIRDHHAPVKYWYLLALAVDPDYQGKGHASTLLKAMFQRIDEEHLPCYLETQDGKNVPIYQHLGFKVVDESVIPNTEVTNWAMSRDRVG